MPGASQMLVGLIEQAATSDPYAFREQLIQFDSVITALIGRLPVKQKEPTLNEELEREALLRHRFMLTQYYPDMVAKFDLEYPFIAELAEYQAALYSDKRDDQIVAATDAIVPDKVVENGHSEATEPTKPRRGRPRKDQHQSR